MNTFSPTVLLRAEQTADHVAVIENRVPARWGGPPLHHHDFDEAFYVLEGELTFQLGDAVRTAGTGRARLRGARRPPHARHLSDTPARYLLICTPASFERHFDRLAAKAAGTEPPAEAAKPYPETIVVGPPIDPGSAGA